MKKRAVSKIVALTTAVVSLMLLQSCTKERPYEQVFKVDVQDKGLIDENAEYLYVPSVVDTPRTASASRPYWMGEQKLVKLKLTENSLDILAMELDGRFSENKLNQKPVLSIPVTHVDYRCQENANGECSNKEEENTEAQWFQKKYFKPNFGSTKVQETNFLPIQIMNLIAGCYSELDSRVVGYTLENDALNLELEKTFKTTINCLDYDDKLEDLTFSVRYFYSLVKLDKLTTPGYEKVKYPALDSRTFGFFTTEETPLSVDHRDEEDTQKIMLNRWNPNRGRVVYSLSDNFEKPKNAAIKNATLEAFAAINSALKQAGSPLHLDVQLGTGKKSGDLRNNMIVMVEDPLSTGLIGYGPSVTNPRTGEILQARTVMYKGNIVAFIQRAYDEIIEQKLEKQKIDAAGGIGNLAKLDLSAIASSDQSLKIVKQKMKEEEEVGAPDSIFREIFGPISSHSRHLSKFSLNTLRESVGLSSGLSSNPIDFNPGKFISGTLEKTIMNAKAQSQKMSDLKSELEFFSANNAYHADQFNFDFAVQTGIKAHLDGLPVKPWIELSTAEKERIIDILVPYVWVPTLVHELGHNLGLRHNFNGSEDKENFYESHEIASLGLEAQPKYSSVMDYAFKTTNELRVMGKYDVAALKFGYSRMIDVVANPPIDSSPVQDTPKTYKSIPVKGSLEDMASTQSGLENLFKPYMFCTDEHVALNPGCNRFDEGTTLTEISGHYVNQYDAIYKRLNTRNGRRSFSLMRESSYIGYIESSLMHVRLVFDTAERITEGFGIPLDPKKWDGLPLSEKDKEFLLSLKSARDQGAQLLVDTIATPDVHCLLALENEPNKIVGAQSLFDVDKDLTSCFSKGMQAVLDRVNASRRQSGEPGFLIPAQLGKQFRNLKSPDSTNAYADQIDVRGVYVDKLLATEMLLKRRHGNLVLDRFQSNYLQDETYREVIGTLFESILLDEVVSQTAVFGPDEKAITDESGNVLKITLGHSLVATHEIASPLLDSVGKRLGLPESQKSDLRVQMISSLKNLVPDRFFDQVATPFLRAFSVYTRIPQNGDELKDFSSIEVSGQRFLAKSDNILALALFQHIAATRILTGQTPENVVAAFQYNQCAADPSADKKCEATEEVKALGEKIKVIPTELLLKFVQGELKEESVYALSLTALAETE